MRLITNPCVYDAITIRLHTMAVDVRGGGIKSLQCWGSRPAGKANSHVREIRHGGV